MAETYKQQQKEIHELIRSIKGKVHNFVRTTKDPYFEDLQKVINDLKEVNQFLK